MSSNSPARLVNFSPGVAALFAREKDVYRPQLEKTSELSLSVRVCADAPRGGGE